jgi:16S rRNA C967 or C1407 C5-methylase (RsmB/RsmF family)
MFAEGMKNTRRLYPHLHDATGFYIAKLRFD